MKTKVKFFYAVLSGLTIGGFFGLVESGAWLAQFTFWQRELTSVPLALMIYGFLGGAVSIVWALLAMKLDADKVQARVSALVFLSLAYFIGGFHANRLWFPEIHTLPSLVFTGALTLGFLIAAFLLLKGGTRGARREKTIWGWRLVSALFVLLLGTSGVSFAWGLMWKQSRNFETASPRAPDRPNVLLIVMDTTRADRFSSYGYPLKTTPHLDRLAEEGILFEQARSAAPWTFPSHASLFTGLYPSQHGADWTHRRFDSHLAALPEILREEGYQTAGFTNNAWVSGALNFNQGFEIFEEIWERDRLLDRIAFLAVIDKFKSLASGHVDFSAAETNEEVRHWFDEVRDPKRPFFLFINYMEPHFIYEPPEPYRERFLEENHEMAEGTFGRPLKELIDLPPLLPLNETQWAYLNGLYDGEIAYLDGKIGELLEDLRRRSVLDETLVILTSDHGDSIGEHGLFQHQYSVYETLVHVPLILRYPKGLPSGIRVTQPVSLLDIVPTLLAFLEIKRPELEKILKGRSLLHALRPDPASPRAHLAQYTPPLTRLPKYRKSGVSFDEVFFSRNLMSLTRDGFKFIQASDGRDELYNLREDPEEKYNLASQFPERAREMEKELEQFLASLKPIRPPEALPRLDKTTLETLRSLGYIQ